MVRRCRPNAPGEGAEGPLLVTPAGLPPRREVIHTVTRSKLVSVLPRLMRQDDEAGQGLAEYALILALIAIVSIIALLFLGNQISDKLSVIGNSM